MFKRVDVEDEIEGFTFVSVDDDLVTVGLGGGGGVMITDTAQSEEFFVCQADIPNLIKALQAAYDYKQKEKQ